MLYAFMLATHVCMCVAPASETDALVRTMTAASDQPASSPPIVQADELQRVPSAPPKIDDTLPETESGRGSDDTGGTDDTGGGTGFDDTGGGTGGSGGPNGSSGGTGSDDTGDSYGFHNHADSEQIGQIPPKRGPNSKKRKKRRTDGIHVWVVRSDSIEPDRLATHAIEILGSWASTKYAADITIARVTLNHGDYNITPWTAHDDGTYWPTAQSISWYLWTQPYICFNHDDEWHIIMLDVVREVDGVQFYLCPYWPILKQYGGFDPAVHSEIFDALTSTSNDHNQLGINLYERQSKPFSMHSHSHVKECTQMSDLWEKANPKPSLKQSDHETKTGYEILLDLFTKPFEKDQKWPTEAPNIPEKKNDRSGFVERWTSASSYNDAHKYGTLSNMAVNSTSWVGQPFARLLCLLGLPFVYEGKRYLVESHAVEPAEFPLLREIF